MVKMRLAGTGLIGHRHMQHILEHPDLELVGIIDPLITDEKIEESFEHTKLNGDVNWQDGDEIDVCLAGTFAADKFISIINRTRSSTTKKNFIAKK